MSILRFTDGVEIDTSGEYRTLKLRDGWYVVGHGTLEPCADKDEATRVRNELLATSARVCTATTQIPGGGSEELQGPKFPHVHVQLSGEDGNVISIIGRVRRALLSAGASSDEVKSFTTEAMTAGSYDGALRTVMRWVDAS